MADHVLHGSVAGNDELHLHASVSDNTIHLGARMSTGMPIKDHRRLVNRDAPDQHPIEAITGLEERLEEIADKTFIFTQSIPADTWVITHSLGKKPSVTVVDSGDNIVVGDVTYIDENALTITFVGAFSGKAYLN